jgi:hypothetical protein
MLAIEFPADSSGGWMKAHVFAVIASFAVCSSALAQAGSEPASAKQLGDWHKAGGAKRQQFQQFISTSYAKLIDARGICMPPTDSKKANRNAAFLAVQSGIEEGLFGEDVPAIDPVRDALGFWFPCPLR